MRVSTVLSIMMKAADKAGRSLSRDFGEVEQLQVSMKGPGDFVTRADKRAEKIIVEELQNARPKFSIIGEEGTNIQGEDPDHCFYIDPLDGTTNFLHSIPLFAVSIGLQFQGEMIAGVVHNPIMNETFFAEKGAGCFVVGQDERERRLRVSGRKRLEDCVVSCGIPNIGRGDLSEYYAQMREIAPSVSGIRRTGAAAIDLAWVAAGRFDGFFELDLKSWDMAAGIVLIKEAGGRVTDHKGDANMLENGHVIAGPKPIQEELQKKVLSVMKPRDSS